MATERQYFFQLWIGLNLFSIGTVLFILNFMAYIRICFKSHEIPIKINDANALSYAASEAV